VLRTSGSLRMLGPADRSALLGLLDEDPVANVFVAARVYGAGREMRRLGGEMWGYDVGGRLTAACYAGANLIPVGNDPEAVRVFAERARQYGRRCSSIVGPAETVSPMWELLEPTWGAAREVRPDQPLLATSDLPRIPPDPQVRRVRPDELDVLMPACVAMFTEEVGVSPFDAGGEPLYRARVAELVDAGRAFARIENGRVLFKAELGAVTSRVCQVQGVWVPPERRGEGLSVAGMAAVVEQTLREVAPTVSLYVNDYNLPARAAYRRVGFTQVGTFMSVLF
jgi:uncharacterized protein